MIKVGIIEKQCGVYVNQNVYGISKQFKNCKIICPPENPHPLMECIFRGTYKECEYFVKKSCNCEK